MNFKKIIIIILVCLFDVIGQVKKATFENVLSIGSNESKGIQYIFSEPRFVDIDSKMNIYIVDKGDMRIRQYNSNGEFIRYIGRRGRGPGEFIDISLFKVLENDKLIVFDMMNARITLFNNNGVIVDNGKIDFNTISWPKGIIELDSSYIVISDLEYKAELFHLFSRDFKENIFSFGKEFYPSSALEKTIFTGFFPNILKIDDSKFIYVPYDYSGQLYYIKVKNKSCDIHKINGYVYYSPSVELLNNNLNDRNMYSVRGFINGQKVVARINNTSKGLTKLSKDKIAHFTQLRKNNYAVLGVEIFDMHNFKYEYYEIMIQKLNNNFIGDIPIRIFSSDIEGNIYLVNELNTFPVIQKVKLLLDVD